MLTKKQSDILDWVSLGLAVAGGVLIGYSLNGRDKTLQSELENEQRKNTILASTCRGTIDTLSAKDECIDALTNQLEQEEDKYALALRKNRELEKELEGVTADRDHLFKRYVEYTQIEAQTDVQTARKLKTLGLSNAEIADYINTPESYVQALLLVKDEVSK